MDWPERLRYAWDHVREMIEYYRLRENDTVYAYDLAWEPLWWGHDKRLRWDRDWEAWIIERYGSLANAEQDWGVSAPRDDAGKVTGLVLYQGGHEVPATKAATP